MALTGYEIITYIDVNPNSPTYNETYTARTYNSGDCRVDVSNWTVISQNCEVISGSITGYYVTIEQDTNPESDTYGQTRSTRVYNATTCPPPSTNADWQIDPTFNSYCETMYYEPAHVLGNTGREIVRLVDMNMHSSTYGSSTLSAMTSSGCSAPSTSPILEVTSSYCQIDGSGHRTGYLIETGIDTNVYSPTYLQTATITEYDETSCPVTSSGECNSFHFIGKSPNITYSGGNTIELANYFSGSTLGTLYVFDKPSWVSGITYVPEGANGMVRIYGNVAENDGSVVRSGVIEYKATDTAVTCSFTSNIMQNARPSFLRVELQISNSTLSAININKCKLAFSDSTYYEFDPSTEAISTTIPSNQTRTFRSFVPYSYYGKTVSDIGLTINNTDYVGLPQISWSGEAQLNGNTAYLVTWTDNDLPSI